MLFFFHCQQWCVILYMFLMLTELSQNKVMQKDCVACFQSLSQNTESSLVLQTGQSKVIIKDVKFI